MHLLKLASFSGSKTKVKQLLCCISLICSYRRTFPIKVLYKVIEILAVRWLSTKLMQIFKETILQVTKLAGRSPGNDDEVSIICFRHKLNIVLEGWWGLRTRLEYYIREKKALFCSLKVHNLKKLAAALCAAKLLSSASHGTACPLHFKFASYAYACGVEGLVGAL